MSRKWMNRYNEFILTYCIPRSVILKDTLEKWIEGTKENGKNYKPELHCEICNFTVTTTTIHDFVGKNNTLGCKCSKRVKWTVKYQEFKDDCFEKRIELLDSEDEWIMGIKKYGRAYKPAVKCRDCYSICESTRIEDIYYKGSINCSCPNINQWIGKRDKFIEICKTRECELLDDEKKWLEGTRQLGRKYKPTMKCLKCNEIFTCRINDFINLELSYKCLCGRVNQWQNRIDEIKEECKNRNTELQIDDEELIEGLRKEGKNFKPPIKCKECNMTVTSTSIDVFMYKKSLGCKCKNSRSETLMYDILNKIFPNNSFIKLRPNWLKNSDTGCNLELDAYCDELKLAFEYNGRQHEEFSEFFHNNDTENFKNQQHRDEKKIKLCLEHNIKLIIIPSKYNYQNPTEMEEFIKECCVEKNEII